MSTTTLSPLRQRMIEDMSLRNLAPRTQEAYIRGCRKLAAFLRRSPDTATAEDIRLFQLHLAEQVVSICTRNRTMTGVVFLSRGRLDRRSSRRIHPFYTLTTLSAPSMHHR